MERYKKIQKDLTLTLTNDPSQPSLAARASMLYLCRKDTRIDREILIISLTTPQIKGVEFEEEKKIEKILEKCFKFSFAITPNYTPSKRSRIQPNSVALSYPPFRLRRLRRTKYSSLDASQ